MAHLVFGFTKFPTYTWLQGVEMVYYNAVVVYLTDLIEVTQVVETNLRVLRQEETIHLPTDTSVNVCKTAIHVHKHYVVIEDKQVDYQ